MLRFKIDSDPMKAIFNEYFELKRDVVDKIDGSLNLPGSKVIEIISSEDTTEDHQVIRIRPFDVEENEQ